MDWETLYCPNRHCRGYGKPFSQGYLVKNGTSRGQPRTWCKVCEASVVLSYGTAYYGLEADPAILRPRCVRWRKAMRCARPRESSKWTRIQSVPGCIGWRATVARLCCTSGTICM